jgi:hypothetical protein
MKIKLRSDDPGPPGPTEWSEMNDWLANLREDADPEPAATVGPSSTAEPQSWADVPAPAEPHDGATTGERPTAQSWGPSDPAPASSWRPSDPATGQSWRATSDPAPGQSWGPSDSGTAQSWQAAGGPAEPQGAAAQPLSASVPEPDGAAEAQPFGPAQSQDAAEPTATAEPKADGGTAEAYGASQAYAVDEPYGAAALDEGDGFYGHYGDYDLDGGHPGLHGAEPTVTTEPSDTAGVAVTDKPGVARVADEASAVREAGAPDAGATGAWGVTSVASESYGAPSAAAADLFETPDAGVTGEAPVTGGSAGPVAPAVPSTFGASWAPVAPVAPAYAAGPVTPEAWMAPVTSGTPAAPAFAATPVAPRVPAASAAPASPGAPTAPGVVAPAAAAPAATAPAPAVEPEPVVRALIGEDLRTPMVWCELEPGSCVSWHGDREALGMADVRARAIAAGWRIDALGRLTCPQCQQRSTIFRATRQVVLWKRGYAMTMAAREAARQGNYQYPQPAFYPR